MLTRSMLARRPNKVVLVPPFVLLSCCSGGIRVEAVSRDGMVTDGRLIWPSQEIDCHEKTTTSALIDRRHHEHDNGSRSTRGRTQPKAAATCSQSSAAKGVIDSLHAQRLAQ
jgi:hypothetical protein